MQHNNVIGKHQATDSFAKNAPPNFWLKDTEKTLLWIQILKILAISVSIFFFISTLRFHLDLKLLDYCQLLTFDSRIRGNRFVGSNQWLEQLEQIAPRKCFSFVLLSSHQCAEHLSNFNIQSKAHFSHTFQPLSSMKSIFSCCDFLSFMTHRILIQQKPVNPNVVFQTREENQRFRNR